MPVYKIVAWSFALGFLVLYFLLEFWNPAASNYLHTYQLSTPPGQLTSRQWSFEFFITASLAILVFVPFSLIFYIETGIQDTWRMLLHMIPVIVFIAWLFIATIFGAVEWSRANNYDPGNFYNKFNDDKWCLVNYIVSGAPCTVTIPAVPTITRAQLATNPRALYEFWFIFLLLLMLIADLVLTLVYWRKIGTSEEEGADDESGGGGGDIETGEDVDSNLEAPLYKSKASRQQRRKGKRN